MNSEVVRSSFRPDIQGLRAVAVIAVVAYHAGLPVPGGFVGVDMFFVISGFVITAMLLREWEKRKRISFRNFYLRRIKRLAPALALMTTVTVAMSFFVLSPFGPQQVTGQTGIGAILNVGNLVIARSTGNYFDPAADSNPLLHTWSLSVEEQFYWIFPALLLIGLFIGSRFRRNTIRVFVPISLFVFSSFAMLAIATTPIFYQAFPWLSAFYNPLMRFWEFAAGVCLALIIPHISKLRPSLAWLSGGLGILLVVASLWLINDQLRFPGSWTLLPVLGTSLLIFSGINQRNAISRFLSIKPMVSVGNYSYSLYLWHWPFIVFAFLLSNGNSAVVIAATVVSFAPAIASYRLVERPIHAMQQLSHKQVGALIAGFVAIPATVIGVYLMALNVDFVDTWQKSINPALAVLHPYNIQGCDGPTDSENGIPAGCEWNAEATGQPIYLLGDSNAGHFDQAVIFAGQELGRPVWISGHGGCSFLDPNTEIANPDCVASNAARLDWLKNSPPGTVIVSNAVINMYRYVGLKSQDQTVFPSEGRQVESDLTENLSGLVNQLQDLGNNVILVDPLPSFSFEETYWPVEGCGILSLALNSCQIQVPRVLIDEQQEVVRDVLDTTAARTGAGILDLNEEFCNESICSNSLGGILRYQDRSHISVDEGQRLGPLFTQKILSMS